MRLGTAIFVSVVSNAAAYILSAAFLIVAVIALPILRVFRVRGGSPRLLFGAASIPSLPAIAAAMREAGYQAACVTVTGPGLPNGQHFDRTVYGSSAPSRWRRRTSGVIEAFITFLWAVSRFDVFNLFFTGGILRKTPLAFLELKLLRLAGIRIVMFPYGSDAFAIERIPYASWREALAADYPQLARDSADVERRIARFSRQASAIVGCLVHCVCLPRWDHLMLTCYPVDTNALQPAFPDPSTPTMRIFHAPNHRALKGTGHLIDAVERLRAEGLPVELELVERMPHTEVMARMAKCAVVVDQLIFGYGLTALEGLAFGKIVITGQNPADHDALFRDHPGYRECPMLRASPETIEEILRNLVSDRTVWHSLAHRGRAYAEAWHSPAATARAWSEVYRGLGLLALPPSR
jgi:hypothetical protein